MNMTRETVQQPEDRIEFSQLRNGDTLHITLGETEEAFRYEFVVDDVSEKWPNGTLKEIRPDGTIVGPLPFSLRGCGIWTTPRENPVQNGDVLAGKSHQEYAFSPYYEGLITGHYLWGRSPDATEPIVFDKEGQHITSVEVVEQT